MNIPNIQKQQQIAVDETDTVQNINDFGVDKTNNNFQSQEQKIKGKKFSYKLPFIIVGAIIAIGVIITLILVFALKKKKKKRTIRQSNPDKTISSTIITDIISTYITDFADLDNNKINYTEAEKLIGLDSIKENHIILEETSNNIDILLSFYNNANLTNINSSITSEPENLDFLIDVNESALEIAENDLDLYISKYSSLSEQANELSNDLSDYINSMEIDEFKEKNIKLNEQFENNIQNLATVFISNSSKLRSLNFDELKVLIDKLNNLYNVFLSKTKGVSENLISSIKLIIDKINLLNIKLNNGILEVNKIIESITNKTKIHEKLIEIKNISISLRQDVDSIKNEINEKKLNISSIKEEIENSNQSIKEENDIIVNITNLISEKKKDDNIKIPELVTLIEPTTELTNNFMIQRTSFENTAQEKIEELEISVIETSTSLDLLFIMDVTGSMEPYIDKVKEDLINIINGVIEESPGIDINLGFVGYRDYYDKFEEIDFTKDHEQFKNIISNIHASGGGYNYYTDEDVAQGLEMALKKSWKSKAKLAVFIGDAPAHGAKYGGWGKFYDEPKRRDLEDIIEDMIKEGIALICVKINNSTDIMYKIFENLYNGILFKNKFKIVENKDVSFTTSVKDYAIQLYYGQKINSEDCLLSKKEAREILKTRYNINNKKPDKNLRFILGKCSPILLVPGLFATKLKVEFNCKGLLNEEKDTTLKNIRLYCGYDSICNKNEDSEEYSLFFSLSGPFSISKLNNKNYGACLGHIATYFQNEKECPKIGNKNICHYSKYVKVGFYGGTTETKNQSKCGVEGIMNVVQTKHLLLDNALSSTVAKVADTFKTIKKSLERKQYKIGFSFAALPNDYRRYLSKNNFAIEVFKSQINRLYKNTGKPVVIVGHSLGTLVTLTNLLLNKDDKEFMKKIKKFIALAPPFSGATKNLDIFFHGMNDFNSNPVVDYQLFGQYLMMKSIPVLIELRPKSIAAKIFLDSSYKELADALRERLELERYCNNNACYSNYITQKTSKFDKIFKGYFPSLSDPECEYENKIGGNTETFNRKCYTNIYNVGECPTIITKSKKPEKEDYLNDSYCNQYGKEFYYQGECDNKERNCLDELFYSNKCPNVFSNRNAVNYLINRFNEKNIYEKINKSYFDDYETIKSGIKKSIEYQNEIDLLKELPIPPVDTELVYASFFPTISTLILDDNEFTNEGEAFYRGGDETVPAWSSLLTGLKWIYDKKKGNLPQKIKLIEYCSRLAKSGQYKYNSDKDQNFAAISCRCLNKNENEYQKKDDIKKCSHARMLQDENLFDYIYSVINDPKASINDNINSKIEVIKNYNEYEYKNIEEKCNDELYNILDTKK